MSLTNFGSILIFTSCVVGTCNALPYVGECFLGGVLFIIIIIIFNIYQVHVLLFSIIVISVGMFTLGGEF